MHFDPLSFKLFCSIMDNTLSINSMCSCQVDEARHTSSMNACKSKPLSPLKRTLTRKVAGAFVSPKGMRRNSKSLSSVSKAVSSRLLFDRGTCQNPLASSMSEKNFLPAWLSRQSFMFGIGNTTFLVTAFNRLKSIHNRNSPDFFFDKTYAELHGDLVGWIIFAWAFLLLVYPFLLCAAAGGVAAVCGKGQQEEFILFHVQRLSLIQFHFVGQKLWNVLMGRTLVRLVGYCQVRCQPYIWSRFRGWICNQGWGSIFCRRCFLHKCIDDHTLLCSLFARWYCKPGLA